MGIQDRLTSTLTASGSMCDDCLSACANVRPRQTVNRYCRRLKESSLRRRRTERCPRCQGNKIVNRLVSEERQQLTPPRHNVEAARFGQNTSRPWYWEGNVQERIVAYLRSKEWQIVATADTASRKQGKDVVAKKSGKELWVSVKGWPEKSRATQARHWFSGAIFDLVLYRDKDPSVYLALGVPGGFRTYNSLSARVMWLRQNLPFEIIMVSESGEVELLASPGIGSL